jgi:glycine/D-amino acid oxidase-like deaminating enzyme
VRSYNVNTTSYWLARRKSEKYPSLDRTLSTDVLIVGGGITGITTANLLSRAGMSVALVERARSGEIDTGHTTAHLTHVTDTRLTDLVGRFGRDHACAAWDAGAAAINQIEANIHHEGISCEFVRIPGYLHAPVTDEKKEDAKKLQEDARYADEFGFDAAYLDRVPYMNRSGVRFSDQAKFHPIKYLDSLVRLIPNANSYLFEQSDVQEFDPKKKRAKVNGHWINYGLVVLATHNPLAGESGLIGSTLFQTKLALYTSYSGRFFLGY